MSASAFRFWLIIIGLLAALLIFTVLLTAYLTSTPRSKPMARAGGDFISQLPAGGEVAVRHPVKDQGRVPHAF